MKLRPMTPKESRAAALLLLVVVVAAILFSARYGLVKLHRHYDDAIADQLDRLARYERVAAMHGDYEHGIAAVKGKDGGRFFLKNSGPAMAASEIQAFVQSVVDANGMRLESMQISPHRDEGGYRRVVISVNVQGTLPQMQKTFYTLESSTPYLFINNLTLRGIGYQGRRGFVPTVGVEPQMQATFELAGYSVVGAKK